MANKFLHLTVHIQIQAPKEKKSYLNESQNTKLVIYKRRLQAGYEVHTRHDNIVQANKSMKCARNATKISL